MLFEYYDDNLFKDIVNKSVLDKYYTEQSLWRMNDQVVNGCAYL